MRENVRAGSWPGKRTETVLLPPQADSRAGWRPKKGQSKAMKDRLAVSPKQKNRPNRAVFLSFSKKKINIPSPDQNSPAP
jgi:hypothetical protein